MVMASMWVIRRLLLVMHTINFARLLSQKTLSLLAELDFLGLLNDIARSTATGAHAVFAAVARKGVFGTEVRTADPGQDAWYTEEREATESHALETGVR
jgi:hypothetical protein